MSSKKFSIYTQQIHKSSSIVIQKTWRGFRKRTKLKNLFYELPKELQFNVLRYIRQDYYIQHKWIPSVSKIYKNRMFCFHHMKQELNRFVQNGYINQTKYRVAFDFIQKEETNTKAILDLFLN